MAKWWPTLISKKSNFFGSDRIREMFLFLLCSTANLQCNREEQFEERKFSVWEKIFKNIFRTLSEAFSAFWQKFWTGLSKLPSTCPEDRFEEKKFLCEKFLFLLFSEIEQKILGLLEKNFRNGCQNCILPLHKNFISKDSFFLENCRFTTVFWPQAKNFRTFQNCILRVRAKILEFSKLFPQLQQFLANIGFIVNAIGKHYVKNVVFDPFEWMILLP